MANGDRAAAVGMDTVPGTDDIRQGYDEINKSRDYLADHRTAGTHPASAITSGVLPTERGGTGRGSLFDTVTDSEVTPVADGLRLLVTDDTDRVYAARNSVLDPRYLGFQVRGTVLNAVEFNEVGAASVEHGLGFEPVVAITQAKLDTISGSVIVQPRGISPSWTDTHILMTAFYTETGQNYVGAISQIIVLAWGAA